MLIDDLNYGYDIGNKLLNVTDDEAHPSGFNDGNIHTQANLPDFVYDAAGNLIRDRNKKITAITYNHLNQPKKLTSDTGEVMYLYDANGNKVQKQVTENRQTQITDYLGGFQYLAGKLDFLPHAEGYVKAVHTGSTTEYHYVYHYTDHLGNIRLSYGRDPETNEVAILKESHYYPFGLTHKGYVGNHRVFEPTPGGRVNLIPVRNYLDDSYRYTFGGKEEQPELGLNWIDHHARNYMPDLGRWMNLDPLAEKYLSISPYAYVANNPIMFVDPDGREIKTHRETADNGTVTVVVTVTGKLVNESGTAYTAEQLQGYADRLAGSIADSYTGTGETVNFRGVANISVASDDNPLSETDHAFRIVDQGSIPGAEGKSGVLGKAPFGENVVYLSEHMLDRKEATEGKNVGTGKTDTGLGTLERTGPHELGHSGNLKHPTPGTMDGNLMHQTKQSNAGKKVTDGQILQIEKDYEAGNLNKGKQKL